jgi:hypothetical protein
MRFPPLRYTLPSFQGVSILYQVSMNDRPELLRFAESLSKGTEGVESVLTQEVELVRLVSISLRSVDFEGEVETLSELPEHRFEWIMANLPPKAVQECFTAILTGRVNEAYEKK